MTRPALARHRRDALETAAVVIVSVAVGLWYARVADQPLFWDEYFHLLAARSWSESGSLAIADGSYVRAAWFSKLVGLLFRAFGESPFVARLPGAVALAAWSVAIFLPVRALAGRPAAWIAALLFCLSPLVIVNTVMVRFYGPAGVLFWLGCLAAFFGAVGPRSGRQRVALTVTSLVSLFFAFSITPLARLWIACLGFWVLGLVAVRAYRSERRWLLLGALAAVGVVVTIGAFGTGWIQPLWAYYRDVPAWGLDRGDAVRWYELLIRGEYPTLWTLLPVAVVFAALRHGPLTGLCAVTFVSGLVFLSFGGPKGERYALPLLPFFFVLWGAATAGLVPAVRGRIGELVGRGAEAGLPAWMAKAAGPALLAAVIAFVLVTNPGFSGIRHAWRGQIESADRPPQGPAASPAAWEEVASLLRPVLGEVDVVVTPNSLQALYHVGRYDVAIQPWVLDLLDPLPEFGADYRTGLPVISTLASLERLVAENERGVVFGERWRWREPWEGIPNEMADYIESTMEPIALPAALGVIAYRW
jgi:hypothetical protein